MKKCLRICFCCMGILLMDVPVNNHIHTKFCCCRYTLLNLCIQQFLTALCITVLGNIADQSNHIHAPLVSQRLKRSFVDIGMHFIPVHSVGTCAPQLERCSILIHNNRCCIPGNSPKFQLSMFPEGCICCCEIFYLSGQFIF